LYYNPYQEIEEMSIVSSISAIKGEDTQRAGAFLAELDLDDDSVVGPIRKFQYYPETINDSRGVEYQTKNVVGSSHPIYQWVHGSERRISFEAIFTLDYSPYDINNDSTPSAVGALTQGFSTVSSFAKNPISSIGGLIKGKDSSQAGLDIAGAIAWLRSKTYPTYYTNASVDPPPKLLLWLENSGITSFVGSFEVDVVPVLLTRCDVTYEAFFRNGRPRAVTISLEFVETIQVGKSWSYVSRSHVKEAWGEYTLGQEKQSVLQKKIPQGALGQTSAKTLTGPQGG
jgi:hypothetical protein